MALWNVSRQKKEEDHYANLSAQVWSTWNAEAGDTAEVSWRRPSCSVRSSTSTKQLVMTLLLHVWNQYPIRTSEESKRKYVEKRSVPKVTLVIVKILYTITTITVLSYSCCDLATCCWFFAVLLMKNQPICRAAVATWKKVVKVVIRLIYVKWLPVIYVTQLQALLWSILVF